MQITKLELQQVREEIQNDLLCLLDGLPQAAQDEACRIVCEHMNPLIDKTTS